jgi:hypothetical protein
MNLFITDIDPKQAAVNLDDKRVRHMVFENFEMMAMWYYRNVENIWLVDFPYWNRDTRMIEPHYQQLLHHPLHGWLSKDISNLRWLFEHTIHLLDEYEFRFDRYHPEINTFNTNISPFIFPEVIGVNAQTKDFRNSSIFKDEKDIVVAYRMTMMYKWNVTDKVRPTWTKRLEPTWTNDYSINNDNYVTRNYKPV